MEYWRGRETGSRGEGWPLFGKCIWWGCGCYLLWFWAHDYRPIGTTTVSRHAARGECYSPTISLISGSPLSQTDRAFTNPEKSRSLPRDTITDISGYSVVPQTLKVSFHYWTKLIDYLCLHERMQTTHTRAPPHPSIHVPHPPPCIHVYMYGKHTCTVGFTCMHVVMTVIIAVAGSLNLLALSGMRCPFMHLKCVSFIPCFMTRACSCNCSVCFGASLCRMRLKGGQVVQMGLWSHILPRFVEVWEVWQCLFIEIVFSW